MHAAIMFRARTGGGLGGMGLGGGGIGGSGLGGGGLGGGGTGCGGLGGGGGCCITASVRRGNKKKRNMRFSQAHAPAAAAAGWAAPG
jgi:hypothetical protein